MVLLVRQMMPRIGGKKLYYLLHQPLTALGVGRDRFFDILRANHMLVIPKRCYHTTTNSKHLYRKYKNLVQEYVPTRPEEVWVSDITYIGGRDKHTYLALVTDAYSKNIMGYDLLGLIGGFGCRESLANGKPQQRVSAVTTDPSLRQRHTILL